VTSSSASGGSRHASADTSTVRRPANLADVRDAMLDTAGPLLFTGGGTKLGWGVAPVESAAVVSSDAMTDVLAYDHADGTVAVQAGMPLSELQATLAGHDQWLAIDPPHLDEGATIGGLLASGDAGPQRVAYGTMRDLVIGATYVLSDGAVGRTGGFVIKNVAGYDMAKLLCGSQGTLAFVAEVVLRVHPRPEASATLRVPCDPAVATATAIALGAAPVEPVAAEWDDGHLWIRYAGHADAVDGLLEQTVGLLAEGTGDPERLDGDEEQQVWDDLSAGLAGTDGQTVVRAASLPTRMPEAARACAAAADRVGVDAALQATVVLGVMTARISGGDASAHAAFVDGWRTALADLGGHAVVRRTAEGVADVVDVWGPPPSGIELMRRVKRQLDPDGRCAPGRFVGGI
jgi:glycolate oxidase FAD binding subunit